MIKVIKIKNWSTIFLIILLILGAYLFLKDDEEVEDLTTNTHVISSSSPEFVMSKNEANIYIDNITSMQKAGWRLFIQNGETISYNKDQAGRNVIIEKAAASLLKGSYELSLDSDGNVVDIKESSSAKGIIEDKRKEAEEEKRIHAEKVREREHTNDFNIIQINIKDIDTAMERGYRAKVSDDGEGTIITWNINDADDFSPALEYSLPRIMDFGISIIFEEGGKVTGFDFAQTDFIDDQFELYSIGKE